MGCEEARRNQAWPLLEHASEEVLEQAYQHMADVLNQAFRADPKAMGELFNPSVVLNNLSDDNPLVCAEREPGVLTTSCIGVINSLFFSERLRLAAVFNHLSGTERELQGRFQAVDIKSGATRPLLRVPEMPGDKKEGE